MRHSSATVVLATALAGAPLAAANRTPTILAPLTTWSVDYGKERCRAARTFGDKDKPTVLVIDLYGPRSSPAWTIAGPAVADMGGKPKLVSVQFGTLEPALRVEQLEFAQFGTFGRALTSTSLVGPPPRVPGQPLTVADAVKQLQADNFDVTTGQSIDHVDLVVGDRVKQLATGPMTELFKVMAHCADSIVSEWGYDPDVERTLSRRATPTNRDDFVRPIMDSYPSYAARIGAQTLVRMRVDVDATGAPKDCTLVEMLDASAFNDFACKTVMKNARFEPALDAAGQPVASYWETEIRYILPAPVSQGHT